MNVQDRPIQKLNAFLEKIVRDWMCVINLDAEFSFGYNDDDPHPNWSEITAYEVELRSFSNFGSCAISESGQITVKRTRSGRNHSSIIAPHVRIVFPQQIMDIFDQYVSQELIVTKEKYLGFNCKIPLNDVDHSSALTLLGGSVRDLRLDAFTETQFRPNAVSLINALQLYADWFDYAAVLADNMMDEERHMSVVRDLDLVFTYLGKGGQLSFAKMTSLCDVAGSLQPVRNLIQTKMPELTV